MNILYVTHYSQIGGANNELLLILEEMKKKGNQVSVALPTEDIFCEILKQHDIKYIISGHKNWVIENGAGDVTRYAKGIVKGLYNFSALLKLVQYVKRNKIDIIHTNDSLSIIGHIVANMCKIPHIWHIREFLDTDYNYRYIYPSFIVKYCYNKSSAIVFISKAIEEKYKNFINRDITHCIYDAIPKNSVNESDKFDCFTVLYAGGGMISKGIYEILNAARIIHERGCKDVKFLITGNCDEMAEEIRRYIKNNNLLNQIDVLGFVTNLGQLQAKSHVFVTCAKKEAFGLITVEAMQNGAVVIGTNSGGTSEIIDSNINGYLYSYGNHQELADLILYVKDNYCKLEDVVYAAKEKINRVYSPTRLGNQLFTLYSSCKERQ